MKQKRHVIFQQTISAHEPPQVTHFENFSKKKKPNMFTLTFPCKIHFHDPKIILIFEIIGCILKLHSRHTPLKLIQII